MKPYNLPYSIALFFGDFCVWFFSLWLALIIRKLELPTFVNYFDHAIPYVIVFVIWAIIAYIFGLYESRVMMSKGKFTSLLLQTQLYSVFISIALFYLVPVFTVKPKLTLFVILATTIVAMFVWRIIGIRLISTNNREKSIYIASGDESRDFFNLINSAQYYPLIFAHYCDVNKLSQESLMDWVNSFVDNNGIKVIVLDSRSIAVSPILEKLYQLSFKGVHFIDESSVYEDITGKVPISLLKHSWLIENISRRAYLGYDTFKRVTDLLISIPLFLITAPLFIPIAFLIRKDGGPAFFVQERLGKDNKSIYIAKFRTMNVMDKGIPLVKNDARITKVGKYLRNTRLDELPQLINVIAGDISLIGPRPEVPGLVDRYIKEIPYYGVRHFIKPGLSGWAQINHEKPPQTVEENREKLAYDLYYIKNRSFMLDIKIALKTVYTLLSRVGA